MNAIIVEGENNYFAETIGARHHNAKRKGKKDVASLGNMAEFYR